MANSWVLKTEPTSYGWEDLVREGRTVWDGVSNPVALANLRRMSVGDEVLIYHTGAVKAIVGIARVVRAAYQDPKTDDTRRVVIDIAPVRPLEQPVTLAAIKAEPELKQLALVRQGRLSCVPVDADQRSVLKSMGVK